jgi:UDP-2,3-diacylglucosamine hydrolase
MSKAYFISDAHLGLGTKEEEKIKEQRLLSFLTHISKDADSLYILGDLFDAWFEYKTVIPKGFHRVISKLDELVQKNINVYYLAGNHDFWMDSYFRDEIGIKTYLEAFDVNVDGKKIYLHHGDGFATNDTGYLILKKIFRNPVNIKLFKLIHPNVGIRIAKKFSTTSRKYTSNKHYGEDDGMRKAAEKKIKEGYDIVMMGHRHVPSELKIENGLYINLGDWINHFTYAEFTNGEIALKKWTDKV